MITVNGSTDGFDGFRIGVAGFDNPLRDSNTSAAIQALGKKFQSSVQEIIRSGYGQFIKENYRISPTIVETKTCMQALGEKSVIKKSSVTYLAYGI